MGGGWGEEKGGWRKAVQVFQLPAVYFLVGLFPVSLIGLLLVLSECTL